MREENERATAAVKKRLRREEERGRDIKREGVGRQKNRKPVQPVPKPVQPVSGQTAQ